MTDKSRVGWVSGPPRNPTHGAKWKMRVGKAHQYDLYAEAGTDFVFGIHFAPSHKPTAKRIKRLCAEIQNAVDAWQQQENA